MSLIVLNLFPPLRTSRMLESRTSRMLESSNGSGKFASVHVEVTFRSIKGIPVYVIQEPLGDNRKTNLSLLSAEAYTPTTNHSHHLEMSKSSIHCRSKREHERIHAGFHIHRVCKSSIDKKPCILGLALLPLLSLVDEVVVLPPKS